jgi:transcriptional regulator of acetoin/glycerol metabolism
VREGRSAGLYYRLNILRIEMPPLRERARPAGAGALLYRRAQERLGSTRRSRCRNWCGRGWRTTHGRAISANWKT